MKKMTLKGKIVTGVVAASIIGSSTFAFATTNAGTEFTAWGNTQITAAKKAVSDSIGASRTNKVGQFGQESTTNGNTSKGNIDTAGSTEKQQTVKAIQDKLAEHVASLNAALTKFNNEIGADFDALVLSEKNKTTTDLNAQYNILFAHIDKMLKDAKAANVKDVTETSLLAKGQATSDLIKKINEVKASLAATILAEKNAAQGEVDAHLQSEFDRVTGLINSLISTLELDAKTAIETAGNTIEASAIENFERVILVSKDQNPITVDKQKLSVNNQLVDGKIQWTVENKNEFDVVYTWKHVSLASGGVQETVYATGKAEAKRGHSVFLTTPTDKNGKVIIEWLDHNGVKQIDEKNEPNNPR